MLDATMSCGWMEEKLQCHIVRGNEFNSSVPDHVTLMLLNASKDHEGTYKCQITKVEPVRYENCSLELDKGNF